ncbi:hypothetical protein [Anoxybacteroides tepidamans]|uniref:hypothetical protein n=1 Tax=Anoxybacteroides tepidamans TaxID=265948 RepID=UPI00047FE21A|nr:hypothetical protein [Anoxybacillus tepidamans]
MHHLIKKAFSLNDIKYAWILLVSFISFAATFYLDLYYNPSFVQKAALAGYGLAFLIATLWAAFNYIGHLRINVMYQKNNGIPAFLEQLALSHEEKLELQAYLEDYVTGQVNQGKSKEEAAREAINQFKVKEFSSLSKNTLVFNLHAHYYLGGYAFLAILGSVVLLLLHASFFSLPWLVGAYTFLAYGVGFIGLFFIYKLVDSALYKKIKG